MATYSTIRELQAKASRLIAVAREGEPMIITSHGKPVAVLTAVSPDQADDMAAAIERLRSFRAFKSLQSHVHLRTPPSPAAIDAVIRRARRSA